MRLLFASPFPYLPDNISGRETTTHAMVLRLVARGVAAAVFAGLPPEAERDTPARVRCDQDLGYPVFRAARPQAAYAEVLAAWRPDCAVLPLSPPCAPLAAIGLAARVRAAFLVTSAAPDDLATQVIGQPGIAVIANSDFTARRLETMFGERPPVLPPLIEPGHYRVDPAGDSVLMINPTPQKGAEIFFRLAAAYPEIPFLAVESWQVSDGWRTVLMNRARALGNVALWPAVEDTREAYARARLMLAPSVFEETFGRIVAEAQVSGIPALVSDRGALPETLGGGGLAVPLDAGFDAWAAALGRIWADPAPYAAAALAESRRPERAPEAIIGRLLQILGTLQDPAAR